MLSLAAWGQPCGPSPHSPMSSLSATIAYKLSASAVSSGSQSGDAAGPPAHRRRSFPEVGAGTTPPRISPECWLDELLRSVRFTTRKLERIRLTPTLPGPGSGGERAV